MAQAQTIQSGQDVTDLMGGGTAPKSGQDVTALMSQQPPAEPTWADTVGGRIVGTGKRLMRAGQQIGNIPKVVGLPGIPEITDKVFGLAPGTSWKASEPSTPAEKQGGDYASILATMALAEAGPKLLAGGEAKALGRTFQDQGMKLETAVNRLSKLGRKSGGAWGYVMQGHPLQGIYAGLARQTGRISAKAIQSVGRLIASDPDAAGQLAVVMDTATAPGGAALSEAQGNFVMNVADQLKSGRTLSGAQKAYIASIFRSVVK